MHSDILDDGLFSNEIWWELIISSVTVFAYSGIISLTECYGGISKKLLEKREKESFDMCHSVHFFIRY
jgi:hypothetical protein